jgi:hypothetical protein
LYSVREATLQDKDWLLIELKKFSDFYGTKIPLVGPKTHMVLENIISNHVLFVCQKGEELVGLIGGTLSPHFFNPDLLVLSEFFWWVHEAHRKTRAGIVLFNKFVSYGTEKGADWITMCLTDHSELNIKTLIKRGFVPKEQSFILEV